MSKPLLIFDGDCGFCRRWIAYWQVLTGDRVDYAPYQEVGHRFPAITETQFENAVQLVEPNGTIHSGAQAVFRTLATRPGLRWLKWVYKKVPGVAPVTELAYRFVAKHRVGFSRLTRWLWGEQVGQARYALTRWIYLKALGVTYFAAFVSFWIQAKGLVGSEGISPSAMSDSTIQIFCGLGVGASVLLLLGWLPTVSTIIAWVSYWFIAKAGQNFLAFQWDSLMLEMGFFSIFLTLGKREPSPLMIWLLRWLLFRVVFFSGYVKLASHDSIWRDLTALQFHFETQPLPTWVGWWFHQLPREALRFCAAVMFVIELGIPFLYFLPRRPRFIAFFATVLLQLLIDVTGNYGFFGWQTVALSLLLLDDEAIENFIPWFKNRGIRSISTPLWRQRVEFGLVLPPALLIVATTIFQLPSATLLAAPLNSIHSYGVFAVMTQTRDEIIFEGSRDGLDWLPYELKWKPGDIRQAPRFMEPHMPRLDWQLWFAALGAPVYSSWVRNVAVRLLQNSEPVLGFFQKNPFSDAPPRYIRARLYAYHFTDLETRRRTGEWWHREPLGDFLPALSLR